jgi:amino acid transporter/nucleotide-binding universal stress UspA family protein
LIEDRSRTLVKELGLSEALAIGLGTMIGAGIFVLSPIAAHRAGPSAAISYVLAGLICIPSAMTVSELATAMPKAGGSYYLISRSLGPLAGAVVGMGNWLGLTFATGFYLIGFAQYMAYFLPVSGWITALCAGLLFLLINYRGAKLSGQMQNFIVMLLVLILGLFVIRGLFSIDPGLHQPFVPNGWEPVIANVGLIIVSFTGFEKISTIAEEIKNPERNLPLAIVGSVLIATILYAAILYVATGILSYQVIADFQAPLVEAANRFMSVIGIAGMSLAALLATASSANAAIMASSRINFAMGRDSILPYWFNDIHPRFLTPHRSILVTGTLAVLLAMSGQAAVLAEISSALFMLSYFLLSIGLLVMHRSRPAWYRPAYRAPLAPWLTILGGIMALAVIGTMNWTSRVAGFGLVVISLAWYAFWGRRKSLIKGELGVWFGRERPLEAVIADIEQAAESSRREILLPMANPATAKSLVMLAAAMARGNPGTEISALKIVTIPTSISLAHAQEYLSSQQGGSQEILVQAARYAEEAGVSIQPLIRAAYGVSSGIVAVAESRPNTRLILLGWHGPFSLRRVSSSIDKEVLQMAPCDVGVFLDRHLGKVKRILIPAGGGPHARLGLRLAHGFAAADSAELVVLRVVPLSKDVDISSEEAAVLRLIRNELRGKNGRVTPCIVQASSIASGILKEARNGYDLLFIGASEEWFIRNWLFGAIPDIVAERAPCSVLMVKKHEPAGMSWLRRTSRRF